MLLSSLGTRNVFVVQPSTEIGDHHNMASNGTRRVTLLGYKASIRIQVFAERLLPEPFNRAGESEELVYHSPRMSSRLQDYAT